MFVEDESKYNFEESVERFEKSVKKHGWEMPKIHDLQETMNKFGKTVKPVKIFELCHPDHAEKILKRGKERIVTSLMPCRVSIYEKHNGKVYISCLIFKEVKLRQEIWQFGIVFSKDR